MVLSLDSNSQPPASVPTAAACSTIVAAEVMLVADDAAAAADGDINSESPGPAEAEGMPATTAAGEPDAATAAAVPAAAVETPKGGDDLATGDLPAGGGESTNGTPIQEPAPEPATPDHADGALPVTAAAPAAASAIAEASASKHTFSSVAGYVRALAAQFCTRQASLGLLARGKPKLLHGT